MEAAAELSADSNAAPLALEAPVSAPVLPGGEKEGAEDHVPKKRKVDDGGGTEAEEALEVKKMSSSTLPLDMVVQICNFVEPATVLALAQTSKSIRSTLLHKSAAPVWSASRRNVAVDNLTGKLPEPKVAFLLQGKVCQVCGRADVATSARFDLQVRVCYACLEANILPASSVPEDILNLHPLSLRCSPAARHSATGKMHRRREAFYWKPEVVATSAYLHAIDPPAARTDRTKIRPSQAAVAFQKEVEQYKAAVATDAPKLAGHQERLHQERLVEESERPAKRLKQLEQRLVAAGFDTSDMWAIPPAIKNSTEPVTYHYWLAVQDEVIRAVQQRRDAQREARLLQEREQRKMPWRSIYDRLSALDEFWKLPSGRPLWEPEERPSGLPTGDNLVDAIRVDAHRFARPADVAHFDRLARVLHRASIPLPSYVVNMITAEPSPFVDPNDKSKGLAPLHSQLTGDQLLELLDRPVALFQCLGCGEHHQFTLISDHMRTRGQNSPAAWIPASPNYLRLIDRMLSRAGLDRMTTMNGYLRQGRRTFDIRLNNGKLLSGYSWQFAGFDRGGLKNNLQQYRRHADLVNTAVSITLNDPRTSANTETVRPLPRTSQQPQHPVHAASSAPGSGECGASDA